MKLKPLLGMLLSTACLFSMPPAMAQKKGADPAVAPDGTKWVACFFRYHTAGKKYEQSIIIAGPWIIPAKQTETLTGPGSLTDKLLQEYESGLMKTEFPNAVLLHSTSPNGGNCSSESTRISHLAQIMEFNWKKEARHLITKFKPSIAK